MGKGVARTIMAVLGATMIFIGVMLWNTMKNTEDERNNIEVYLYDGKTQVIEFESLSLVPGDECGYRVVLKDEHDDQYKLELDFRQGEESTLQNFARVKFVSSGVVIYDDLLANAIENDDMVLNVDFEKNKNTVIDIIYYLPIETGNEAKNAVAVFELYLEASNEEVDHE